MEARRYFTLGLLIIQIVFSEQWKINGEEKRSVKVRKSAPEHSKQYGPSGSVEAKRWTPSPGHREIRKKPSGHLTPLNPDDIDSDGVVSVAVGPPPVRPKFDKINWRRPHKNNTAVPKTQNNNAVNFVRDVLTQLGREFLSNQVNEDFVFGQYVGNAMKNLTSEIRLKMQHEILDIIVKYQRINRGDTINEDRTKDDDKNSLGLKIVKSDKNTTHNNETEEPWPDFSNLAKIVG